MIIALYEVSGKGMKPHQEEEEEEEEEEAEVEKEEEGEGRCIQDNPFSQFTSRP